ncbi:MAG: type IV secretion system DNA-binding domain-containing protein [Leptolinea sp.]
MGDENKFYLGRIFDNKLAKVTTDPFLYDSADLTTHAVITGMTGSGKTGFCIGLLEEAALKGIPAIVVDPKGDLTNLLLHFPELLPADFQPWIDPDSARREGKTVDALAGETADSWKKGLADWGLGKEQLQKLKDSVEFTIYTPGSSSGVPVNILASFQSPDIPWSGNEEILREKIASIVAALLGLVGLTNIDPLRSREHILVSNLLETAWSKGQTLQLSDLILQVQNPPFERLGALPVDGFFPEKDRFELSMLLNNFMASPSFQIWLTGDSLDIQNILYKPNGDPRHSIFYIAHLSEGERMFFVTMLYAAIESWMRGQRGTSSLRALVYFDEIMGYLPPVANPPSRTVILRMLKQARAFGVGLVLATQNPVDLDYKALSNAGTWVIGRLQTEQDKNRLLDGLTSAAGGIDRGEIDKLLSGLGKRVFLVQNVHSKKPELIQTRWCLNYLAGPMTRNQIPALNALVGVKSSATKPVSAGEVGATGSGPNAINAVKTTPQAQTASSVGYTTTRPGVPQGMDEFFLPANVSFTQASQKAGVSAPHSSLVYKPALFGQLQINYLARSYNLDFSRRLACLVDEDVSGRITWEDFVFPEQDFKILRAQQAPANVMFDGLPGWLSEIRRLSQFQNDYEDWAYRTGNISILSNKSLKVFASPETKKEDFLATCKNAAEDAAKVEIDKIEQTFETKVSALAGKIKKQKMEIDQKQSSLSARRTDEIVKGASVAGNVLLRLFGGKKSGLSSALSGGSSTLNKHRMAEEASARLEQEKSDLSALEEQLALLDKNKESEKADVLEKWAKVAEDIQEISVAPAKKDIYTELFGIAWLPYFTVKAGMEDRLIPAFKRE